MPGLISHQLQATGSGCTKRVLGFQPVLGYEAALPCRLLSFFHREASAHSAHSARSMA